MRIMRFLIVLFAALVVLPLAALSPAAADVDVYTTEGTHHVNGRDWRTRCEPYSATRRCWTEIIATTVTHTDGRYVRSTDWTFNNLTYTAAPRSLWRDNPLAAFGRVGDTHEWTADDGRQWRTECDTATTGGNGCRSYVFASVVEADGAGPAARFHTVSKWVFNSMVRFLPAPPKVGDPLDRIVDPGLRGCVAEAMVSYGSLDAIPALWCDSRGIKTLRGFPAMPRLTDLDLADNALTSLSGLPTLPRLESLSVNDNGLTTLTGMPSLPALTWLDASANSLTSLTGLAAAPRLEALDAWRNRLAGVLDLSTLPRGVKELNLSRNALTRVAGSLPGLDRLLLEHNRIGDAASIVAAAPRLTILDLGGNLVADASPLARLGSLQYLNLHANKLTSVTGLTKLPKLAFLYLHENQITSVNGLQHLPVLDELFLAKNNVQDLRVLKPLHDRGCTIDIWP
ncbi:hypothetical protein GCM10028820_13820 [Tessaracoccus terricola]